MVKIEEKPFQCTPQAAGVKLMGVKRSLANLIRHSPKAELHLHTSGSVSPVFLLKWGKDIDWEDQSYPSFREIEKIEKRFGVNLNQVFKTQDSLALARILGFLETKGDLVDYLSRMRLGHRLLHNNLLVWEELAQSLIGNDVTIEACLSSILQASPELIPEISQHPLMKWIEQGLKVTLSTDNVTTSHTTLTQQYLLAARAFALSEGQVEALINQGFAAKLSLGDVL